MTTHPPRTADHRNPLDQHDDPHTDQHAQAHASRPAMPGVPQPLRDCQPGDVVTTALGEVVVMLHPATLSATPVGPYPDEEPGEPTERARYDLVEVFATHRAVHLPADALVTPVTDPAVQLQATRAAVDALAYRRRIDAQTQDNLRAEHARVMADIRAFAIERHLTGDTDAEELNQFLTHFGMPTYQPRLRVAFTITGSYDVTGEPDDIPTVRQDADRAVHVHLDDVDGLLHGTQAIQVRIDTVTAPDLEPDALPSTAVWPRRVAQPGGGTR